MKKVININFQGRVVPIEEYAYDILKQYVESLRRFFANEEGRDEIINDIEGRIAELFGETLKKGNTCITEEDVNTIIAGMGRPEDFEEEETKVKSQLGSENTGAGTHTSEQFYNTGSTEEGKKRGRLYRDEDDKILGGVCAGLANYLRIDPAIVRILFAIITIGGFGAGFLIYILLWIILPKNTLERTAIRKRLFRNPEDKVIAGVAGGVAAYFDIAVWIPRLIFAFPLLLGILTSIFRNIFWDFDPFPSVLFGSFGSTLFVVYVVLWAVIPEANSASEKLEMRGEKVDLNTIKNTIQEDLVGFRGRAEKLGADFKDKAQQMGSEFGTVAKKNGSRLGHAIGIIFKAFFLFFAGILAFGLLVSLIGLLIGGVSFLPLKNFFLDGFGQQLLAWGTVLLFIGAPVLAFFTWLVRRILRIKSKNPYLGYIFGGLWVIGLVCAISLLVSVVRSYRTKSGVEEKIAVATPSHDKLYVTTTKERVNYYGSDWYGIHWDDDDAPFYGLNEDSLIMRTVRVNITKSQDSAYHIQMVKFSHGENPDAARNHANKIEFRINQMDSMLVLARGFAISQDNKFHNQQVLVIIEVPLGKKIELDESINGYKWFNVNVNYSHRRGWNMEWEDNWNDGYHWNENTEYVMTKDGLKSTKPSKEEQEESKQDSDDAAERMKDIENQKKELEKQQEELKQKIKDDSTKYHYEPAAPTNPAPAEKPAAPAKKTAEQTVKTDTDGGSAISPAQHLLARFAI